MKKVKNIAESIRASLLKKAKSENRPFNELLQYYAMERFLFRLMLSEHSEQFILKGALMLSIWQTNDCRATMDIDLLGRMKNDVGTIILSIKNIIEVRTEPDGLVFNSDSIQAELNSKIHNFRVVQVILDSDLALLYGVEIKRLNEQVKRNKERFPEIFCFQLTEAEVFSLRSQFATLKKNKNLKS